MIPLVLLAGFLGAGKTRFLTDVVPLLHNAGIRVRIVLNDFENANIDAERLGSLNALVTPLNGECVCCTTLPELMQTLQGVPPDPGSVLLIEANGATDAIELLANLTTDRRMAHFTPPLQLTVIDAARWQKRWWHNALERSQTVTATHVFLNWTQKLSADRLSVVEHSIRDVAPRAAFTSPAQFAASLTEIVRQVRDTPQRKTTLPTAAFASDSTDSPHEHHHHAHTFASVAFSLPREVSREPFLQFVRTLPIEVVRAKGLVRFQNEPGVMFVWNKLPDGNRVELDKVTPHESAPPSALFIGVAMPVADLAARVARLTPIAE
ncbi:MAG: GTP-binding protein [Gemmatimonadaceae bacterium]